MFISGKRARDTCCTAPEPEATGPIRIWIRSWRTINLELFHLYIAACSVIIEEDTFQGLPTNIDTPSFIAEISGYSNRGGDLQTQQQEAHAYWRLEIKIQHSEISFRKLGKQTSSKTHMIGGRTVDSSTYRSLRPLCAPDL